MTVFKKSHLPILQRVPDMPNPLSQPHVSVGQDIDSDSDARRCPRYRQTRCEKTTSSKEIFRSSWRNLFLSGFPVISFIGRTVAHRVLVVLIGAMQDGLCKHARALILRNGDLNAPTLRAPLVEIGFWDVDISKTAICTHSFGVYSGKPCDQVCTMCRNGYRFNFL